jgi:hypothetical protein
MVFPANVRLDWKVIANTNTLAYLASSSATKGKSFTSLTTVQLSGFHRRADLTGKDLTASQVSLALSFVYARGLGVEIKSKASVIFYFGVKGLG